MNSLVAMLLLPVFVCSKNYLVSEKTRIQTYSMINVGKPIMNTSVIDYMRGRIQSLKKDGGGHIGKKKTPVRSGKVFHLEGGSFVELRRNISHW